MLILSSKFSKGLTVQSLWQLQRNSFTYTLNKWEMLPLVFFSIVLIMQLFQLTLLHIKLVQFLIYHYRKSPGCDRLLFLRTIHKPNCLYIGNEWRKCRENRRNSWDGRMSRRGESSHQPLSLSERVSLPSTASSARLYPAPDSVGWSFRYPGRRYL